MTYLQIGGQERPILFGFAALYAYEQRTGRKALEDFAASAAQNELTPDAFSIVFLVDLVHAGLMAGCRKLRQPVDFDEVDVAEWLTDNQEAIAKAMQIFTESFPKAEKNAPGPALPVKRK